MACVASASVVASSGWGNLRRAARRAASRRCGALRAIRDPSESYGGARGEGRNNNSGSESPSFGPPEGTAGNDARADERVEAAETAARAAAARRHVQAAVDLRERLETSMQAAVKAEDFALAITLRDQLRDAERNDQLFVATEALQLAVEEERYEDAAVMRDRVAALTPPPPPAPVRPPRLPTNSDVTTNGVNVRVLSQYVASRSHPTEGHYLFAYSIRITNDSGKIIQLCARRWQVTDDNGRTDVVRGEGVVGQTPVLLPGQSFEYASACPMRTAVGEAF